MKNNMKNNGYEYIIGDDLPEGYQRLHTIGGRTIIAQTHIPIPKICTEITEEEACFLTVDEYNARKQAIEDYFTK